MNSYLQNRRGNYHVRIRVPKDLTHVIPQTEILKSLKTKDRRIAKESAHLYLQDIFMTFSLLRNQFITPEQALGRLSCLVGKKRKVTSHKEPQQQKTKEFKTLHKGEKLSTIAAQFVKYRQHEWTLKTKMETEAVFKLLIDLMDDVEIQFIDRQRARDVRDMLLQIPPNLYKVYPNQTARQVVERITSSSIQVTPMSITSVNKHISRLNTLMLYAIKEGYIKENPSCGLTIRQKRKPDSERKAYDRADIKRIIDNLPHDQDTPEKYWIPLIGMYSGMRLDEVCQLYTADIKEVAGVVCIEVNDDGDKKLKSVSSKRIVPVHPVLVSLGFLNYVESLKTKGQERLWGNLKRREADGYSNAYGKCYQRFNRHYVTKDPLKCFHSLRHSFANCLKQKGLQESLIAELIGHANGSITTGRYGKRYQPKMLHEAISLVNYD